MLGDNNIKQPYFNDLKIFTVLVMMCVYMHLYLHMSTDAYIGQKGATDLLELE